MSERAVTNRLDRYDERRAVALADERRAVALADDRRRKTVRAGPGKVILGVDGLQPDAGHEVRWVIRDGPSGEILLARSRSSSGRDDRAGLRSAVEVAGPVPVAGVVSEGRHPIRKAGGPVFPGGPYPWCPFQYLREAGRPIDEADRHATTEWEKKVR
ncbi:MAG TPA: ISNCY family transposase, partial [Urbifossiella sp.]|nr:ISNCY family transposase [Urbifossiella sp.]